MTLIPHLSKGAPRTGCEKQPHCSCKAPFHTSVFEGYSNWENKHTPGEMRDLSMFWRCGISQAPVLFACLSTMPADDHEVNTLHPEVVTVISWFTWLIEFGIISFTELECPSEFLQESRQSKKKCFKKAYIYHKVKNEYFHCKPRSLTSVNLGNCGYSSVLWFYTSICIAGFNIGFSLLKDTTGRLVMPYIL